MQCFGPKLNKLIIFISLEVVGGANETQFQVGEHLNIFFLNSITCKGLAENAQYITP